MAPVSGTRWTAPGRSPLAREGLFLKTRRERLRDLLATREEGFSLEEIEDIFDARRTTILNDLRHLQLSLRHREQHLLMVPPRCETCGYVFRLEEPRAPGRCPACKSEAVVPPVFKVGEAEA